MSRLYKRRYSEKYTLNKQKLKIIDELDNLSISILLITL